MAELAERREAKNSNWLDKEAKQKAEPKPKLWLMGGLALLCLMPGLGSYQMLDPTDSFFIEAAREMLVAHHYLTPLFNYSDWLDKPALPFLLIVACYKMFGISAWAARLPSALSAVILTIFTYRSATRFLGWRIGLFAGLILASSPLFSLVGHLALSDEPLALFLGVALLGFARALILEERKSLFLAYISLGLAVLCKGPVGLLLSAFIVASYIMISSQTIAQGLSYCQRLNVLSGAAIILLICLPYYLLAHVFTNGAFSREFFLHQNLGRFQGIVNHQEPIWWYVPIVLFGFFPSSLALVTAGKWVKALWLRRWQGQASLSFLLFCCLWVLLVFLFFSAIPTKLPTYIVPVSPALAILAAAYLDHLVATGGQRRLTVIAISILVTLLVALAVTRINCFGLPTLNFSISATAGGLSLLLMLVLMLLAKQQLESALWLLILAVYGSCALIVPLSLSQFYQKQQAGIERLVKLSKQRGATLGTLFSTVPSAIFLYEKRIEILSTLAEVKEFSKKGLSPHYLLATSNCLKIPELKAAERTVDKDGKWYLLSVDGYPGEEAGSEP